jgi:hypothetical protein
MKLLIIQFSPASNYFLSLSHKFSKLPSRTQAMFFLLFSTQKHEKL